VITSASSPQINKEVGAMEASRIMNLYQFTQLYRDITSQAAEVLSAEGATEGSSGGQLPATDSCQASMWMGRCVCVCVCVYMHCGHSNSQRLMKIVGFFLPYCIKRKTALSLFKIEKAAFILSKVLPPPPPPRVQSEAADRRRGVLHLHGREG